MRRGAASDPDPLVVASVIFAGVSAAAGTANAVLQYLRRREAARREGEIPSRLFFKLRADLERLLAQERILRRFLEAHQVSSSVRLQVGSAPIPLDGPSLETYRRLVRDCLKVVKDLADDGIELATWLYEVPEQEDLAANLQHAVNQVNELRYAETYESLFTGLEEVIPDLVESFGSLARVYGRSDGARSQR